MVKFVTYPNGADSAAGSLVWVQRRNGSWWPAQIMHFINTRFDQPNSSQVPIKLLGRDDVHVEWYNLEVAKDVKAFRCGDLNSCIEKAKALQANSSKRKHKISQRDNAIILALELEASLMSKDRVGNLCGANDLVNRKRTWNHSEHDDREGIKKQNRGLDDMGMGPNSLESKSIPQNPSSLDNLCRIMDRSRGVCMTYIRKKRSKVVFEEIRKEDSIDLHTNLIQSDNLVSVPIIHDEYPSPCMLSDSNDVSGENLCYNANSIPELINKEGLPSCVTRSSTKDLRVNEARETENSLLGWQSKHKRNPRRKRQNPEDHFDRYKFLESFIKPHTSQLVYYDVKIEVDKSHCSKNGPNISLKSTVNRKPVLGQPISVEVLEDGSCDFLLDTRMNEDCELTETRMRSMETRTSACIPIKVVFSRIHEALDGSVSKG